MTLNQLQLGGSARISAIHLKGPIKRRLVEMGITVGSAVQLIDFAPLGDPINLRINRQSLSIRKYDASSIEVVPC